METVHALLVTRLCVITIIMSFDVCKVKNVEKYVKRSKEDAVSLAIPGFHKHLSWTLSDEIRLVLMGS